MPGGRQLAVVALPGGPACATPSAGSKPRPIVPRTAPATRCLDLDALETVEALVPPGGVASSPWRLELVEEREPRAAARRRPARSATPRPPRCTRARGARRPRAPHPSSVRSITSGGKGNVEPRPDRPRAAVHDRPRTGTTPASSAGSVSARQTTAGGSARIRSSRTAGRPPPVCSVPSVTVALSFGRAALQAVERRRSQSRRYDASHSSSSTSGSGRTRYTRRWPSTRASTSPASRRITQVLRDRRAGSGRSVVDHVAHGALAVAQEVEDRLATGLGEHLERRGRGHRRTLLIGYITVKAPMSRHARAVRRAASRGTTSPSW